MEAAFGSWHWLANGVLFGVYHLHQTWGIPRSVVDGVFLFALSAALLRSTWISIAVHSTQSVFFAVVLMPLVLGRTDSARVDRCERWWFIILLRCA